MKARIIFLLLSLAALSASRADAQITVTNAIRAKSDTIGQAQLLVQYDTRYIVNVNKPENITEETMMLEVGKNLSKFYSYTKYVCDSIIALDYANNASQETINEHMKQFGKGRMNERTFKGYPTGKVTTLDEVAGLTLLRCEEKEERPQWTILAESDTLLSYLCGKAECDFKGRRWTAWFTAEIPVSEGPWKLCGLPGLILKAQDSEGHYTFTAIGVEQCRNHRPILFDGTKHEPVSRKAYNKIHERYYADMVGFITGTTPNVKIETRDENGNLVSGPKNIPHNPLERNSKEN